MSRHHRNLDPHYLNARFTGTCAETGQAIKKGERCLYQPADKKVFKADSNRAREWDSVKADDAIAGTCY